MHKASIFNESAAVAQVEFRVRCETLGHGEDVFLIRSDDPNLTSVSAKKPAKSCKFKTLSLTPRTFLSGEINITLCVCSQFLCTHLLHPIPGTVHCILV